MLVFEMLIFSQLPKSEKACARRKMALLEYSPELVYGVYHLLHLLMRIETIETCIKEGRCKGDTGSPNANEARLTSVIMNKLRWLSFKCSVLKDA